MHRGDRVCYVLPRGDMWLVQRVGARAAVFRRKDDAIRSAQHLAATTGLHVRVVNRQPVIPTASRAAGPEL